MPEDESQRFLDQSEHGRGFIELIELNQLSAVKTPHLLRPDIFLGFLIFHSKYSL
jgi:hypothetical protein